ATGVHHLASGQSLACQYHPEFQSRPNHPHPLFKGFIAASLANEE
ncbi:MAG: glutamine amidotransferase-related protein, partial [Spartobacteria bacterium]